MAVCHFSTGIKTTKSKMRTLKPSLKPSVAAEEFQVPTAFELAIISGQIAALPGAHTQSSSFLARMALETWDECEKIRQEARC